MTEEIPTQVDAFVTPGSLLKAARQAQGISEREAADRLNFMPGYIAILERDDYQALRSPPFARGYVKAYGKMLGLDEDAVLAAFDQLRDESASSQKKKVSSRPLQLQRTGIGVVVGLCTLGLLVLALWWWQGERERTGAMTPSASIEAAQEMLPRADTAGES